jgi:hypothetical protein
MFTKILRVFVATAALSCSSHSYGDGDAHSDMGNHPDAGHATGSGGRAGSGSGGTGASAGAPILFVDASRPPDRGSNDDAGAACVRTASAETALAPVHLAFAFDVSGSMGKLDFPYHDPKLKWEPVVAAAKGFFGDARSSNLFASLVFFPIDSGESKRCAADSYAKPDVPVTALPSDAFASAIDAITPKSSSDWRGGTPTLAVLEGTLGFIEPLAKDDPASKYAIVLVSDGYPQGCSDTDDKIETVVAAVKKAAADIPTYVIGVANPPGGPDTVTNLNDIAAAGGTKRAFIIQTGDPSATISAFQDAVGSIRDSQLTCDFEIPPLPAGQSFDPTRANVDYASSTSDASASTEELAYDADCQSNRAWRYDDPAAPTRMVLCDATCTAVRADPHASLHVEFGCTRRDVIR